MDVFEAIAKRRSIKPERMRPDAIPRADLERILEAANWAPSHGRTEPWRFVVFEGEARRALAEAVLGTMEAPPPEVAVDTIARMTTPPIVIAIVCAASSNPKIVEHEEVIATGIAVHNMHLAARALGIAGYWTSGRKAFDPRMASFLGLTPPARCLGFFYLGYPAGPWPESARRPIAEKIRYFSSEPKSR